jgi:DNA polymerase III epsilon subunit-like protein
MNISTQKTQETNLMLDMETLGTRPGCAILSIAAVPFSSQYDLEPFYMKISATSCTESGLHVDDATLAWWNKQSPEAYREAFSGKLELRAVLSEFADYCNHLPHAPVVWGNGADFDCSILAETYKLLGMKQPWKYHNSRCYRTLKNLFPFVLGVKPVVAHNALEDAKAQAAHATEILRVIAGRRA